MSWLLQEEEEGPSCQQRPTPRTGLVSFYYVINTRHSRYLKHAALLCSSHLQSPLRYAHHNLCFHHLFDCSSQIPAHPLQEMTRQKTSQGAPTPLFHRRESSASSLPCCTHLTTVDGLSMSSRLPSIAPAVWRR